MSAKYKSPSFLLPNEINTNTNPLNTDGNPATGTGVNSLYSMNFEASDNKGIYCGPVPTMFIGDSSVSVWFNSEVNNTQNVIFNRHAAGTGNFNDTYVLRNEASGSGVKIKLELGNPLKSFYSQNVYSKSVWHHLAVTLSYSSGQYTVKFYIDGVEDSPTNSPMTMPTMSSNSTLPLTIGALRSGSNFVQGFKGDIDEVAIFNRALDSTEINALYGGTSPNIYPSNLMASNLNPIAYYPLGEQAQNTGYPSATGNEWQFPNGVLQDYVMDFDGATIGDYIDVGDIPLEGVYTISFWINPDATPSSISFLLDKGDGGSNISVRVTQRNNNAIRFQIGSSYLESTDTLTNNSWNNVILIANGSSSKIYINNGTSPNGTLTTAPNTTQSLLIGTDEGRQSTYYFNGQMSNVVIWNTDQSANIDDIYNNGSPQTSYTVTPQNWWKLNADSVYTPSAPNYTKALSFDGAQNGDYISLGNLSSILSADFTISMWVYFTDTNERYGVLFSSGTAYSNSIVFQLTSTGFHLTTGGTAANIAFPSPSNYYIQSDKWYHYVYTVNGTTGKVYIDGLQIDNDKSMGSTRPGTEGTGAVISNYAMNIGGNSSYTVKGNISNTAIFNSALSDSQISTLFNFGTPETNISFSPTAWWKLDDQNAITDYSGNGNTGTNNGATDATTSVAVVPSWKIPSALPIPTINYTTAGSFNGTSSKIVTTEENLGTTNTISFWHKRPTGMSNKVVIGGNTLNRFDGTILLNTTQLAIGFPTDKALYFVGSIFDASQNASGVNIPYENVWVHYCITRNGTTQSDIKLYINSYLVTTSKSEPFGAVDYTTNTTILNLGAASGQSIFSEGELSNVSTFSSAFTQAQVNTLYNNGQPSSDISSLSPVNWWKLDTIGSTITDNGSAGNNGTNTDVTAATTDVKTSDLNIPVNGVSTTLPSTALQQSDLQFDSPYSNYSLNFDGTGDYITVTQDFSSYTSMSVSGWVRTASTSQYQYLFSTGVYNGGTPGNGQGFGIGFDNTGKFAAWAGGANYFTFGSVSANTWYHVIQTITGTTLRFYVNGVLTSTQTVGSFNIPSSAIAVIGAYSGNSIPTQSNLYGKADELSIFNYELTTSQVLEIYNNGRPKDLTTFSGTAPTNWWRLGENAYFDNNSFIVPNSISGAPNGTGSGTITTMISADAPGTYANGIGTNLDILDRVGDAALSTSNSQSYNMIPSDKSPYVPQYLGDQIANNFSMTFDGTNYFDCGNDSSLTPINEISISLWIKTNTTSQTQFSGPLDKHVSGTGGYQFFFPNSSSSEIKFALGNPKVSLTSTTQVGDTNWHHILATCDNVNCKLYIDGVLESTVSANLSTLSNSENLKIGGDGVSTFYFNGQIDEVAIFDTALNAGQIYNDIYQPTASAPGNNQTADLVNNPNLPNPVAWYRMGD